MQTDCGIDERILLSNFNALFQRAFLNVTVADLYNDLDSVVAGALNNLITIIFKAMTVNVSMRINERCAGHIAYFNLAPIGTSSRKPAKTGLPSSPTEAATTIP